MLVVADFDRFECREQIKYYKILYNTSITWCNNNFYRILLIAYFKWLRGREEAYVNIYLVYYCFFSLTADIP